MVRIFLLWYALIATPLLAAEEYRYFIAPPSWSDISLDEMPSSVKRCSIGRSRYIIPPIINVTAEETTLSSEEYASASKAAIESGGRAIVTGLGTIQTAGGEAFFSIIDTSNPGGTIRSMQATLVNEGVAYNLTVSALKKEFADFYDDFFDVLRSFAVSAE